MPGLRLLLGAGGGQDDGVSQADQDGAVGLLGHPAGLDREGVGPEGHLDFLHFSLSPLRPGDGSIRGRRWSG